MVEELEAIHKPFVILLNCVEPQAPESLALAAHLQEKYGHAVLPVSCAEMTQGTIHEVLRQVLLEFPVKELAFAMPKWVTMLSAGRFTRPCANMPRALHPCGTSRPARARPAPA